MVGDNLLSEPFLGPGGNLFSRDLHTNRKLFSSSFLALILEIENADSKLKYVPLINSELQFCLSMGEKSSRHKVINNLLGTPNFSHTVFKTPKINQFITSNLHGKNTLKLKAIHKDILYRTAAFLLLKDSKASFNIEGENCY